MENPSDRSTSTFEQDLKAKAMMKAKYGRAATTSSVFLPNQLAGVAPTPSDDQSTSTFEKDYNVRSPQKQLSSIVEASFSRASAANKPGSGLMVDAVPAAPSPAVAAAALRQQQQPQQPQQQPPRRESSLIISPLSVPTVNAPSVITPLSSTPSNTAFESDTNTVKNNTNNPGIWVNNNTDNHFGGLGLGSLSVPPGNTNNNWAEIVSLSGFEKDAKVAMNSGSVPTMDRGSLLPNGSVRSISLGTAPIMATTTASMAASVAPSMAGTTKTAATGLSAAAKQANAQAAAAQAKLPKISELVMELSPNAIDKGVKLRDREGGVWGRLLCHFGV